MHVKHSGSGKTYIAVLLIRWLAAQNSGTRKIHVFIVPRVPLVQQQADFIAAQVPLTVRGYYGAVVDSVSGLLQRSNGIYFTFCCVVAT